MKRNDFMIIGIIVFIAIAGGIFFYFGREDGSQAIVKINGEIYETYSLKEEQTILIPVNEEKTAYNQLVIKDGYADIIDASCPDKLCVHQKKISKRGESLVCLPNKVIVEIDSKEEGSLDAVAN